MCVHVRAEQAPAPAAARGVDGPAANHSSSLGHQASIRYTGGNIPSQRFRALQDNLSSRPLLSS